jgi:hypothetical protein
VQPLQMSWAWRIHAPILTLAKVLIDAIEPATLKSFLGAEART